METLGYGLMGDLEERVGLVCALVPLISFGCYPWILVPWDVLY